MSGDITCLIPALCDAYRVGRQAVDKWGDREQVRVAIGELAELIAELAQAGRGRHTEDALTEEVADALIVLMQLVDMQGPANVAHVMLGKLARLQGRIDAETPTVAAEIDALEERLIARHGLNYGQLRRLEGKPDNQRQLLALLHAWDDNPDEVERVISGVPYKARAVAKTRESG